MAAGAAQHPHGHYKLLFTLLLLCLCSVRTQDEIIDLDQVQLQGATAAAADDAEVSVCTRALLVARRCVPQRYHPWLSGMWLARHTTQQPGAQGQCCALWSPPMTIALPLLPRLLVVPHSIRSWSTLLFLAHKRNTRQEASAGILTVCCCRLSPGACCLLLLSMCVHHSPHRSGLWRS